MNEIEHKIKFNNFINLIIFVDMFLFIIWIKLKTKTTLPQIINSFLQVLSHI